MTANVFDAREAAAYYDDQAVSEFYRQCWGGADIHIGLYATGNGERGGHADFDYLRYEATGGDRNDWYFR